jgi:hypothetical protein
MESSPESSHIGKNCCLCECHHEAPNKKQEEMIYFGPHICVCKFCERKPTSIDKHKSRIKRALQMKVQQIKRKHFTRVDPHRHGGIKMSRTTSISNLNSNDHNITKIVSPVRPIKKRCYGPKITNEEQDKQELPTMLLKVEPELEPEIELELNDTADADSPNISDSETPFACEYDLEHVDFNVNDYNHDEETKTSIWYVLVKGIHRMLTIKFMKIYCHCISIRFLKK